MEREAMTPATRQKREQLRRFIERVMAPEAAVQGVVAIGSVASGHARAESDINAIVFLDPFDPYIVPAEFVWRPAEGSFHRILGPEAEVDGGIQFDFARLDLALWEDPAFTWPEGRRAELSAGWLAFDRGGRVGRLIEERTAYTDAVRTERLDDAITWLDQHLHDEGPERRWAALGPVVAHDRLLAAYHQFVHTLFAYNRVWRPWRNREMSYLLRLRWLPERFEERALTVLAPPEPNLRGYTLRVEALRGLFHDLIARLIEDEEYTDNIIEEAFVRSHHEPGRAWNMDEWNQEHARRRGHPAGQTLVGNEVDLSLSHEGPPPSGEMPDPENPPETGEERS